MLNPEEVAEQVEQAQNTETASSTTTTPTCLQCETLNQTLQEKDALIARMEQAIAVLEQENQFLHKKMADRDHKASRYYRRQKEMIHQEYSQHPFAKTHPFTPGFATKDRHKKPLTPSSSQEQQQPTTKRPRLYTNE